VAISLLLIDLSKLHKKYQSIQQTPVLSLGHGEKVSLEKIYEFSQ